MSSAAIMHALSHSPGTSSSSYRKAALDALRQPIATVMEWQRRARERHQLASMDQRTLRDLGLSNIDLWCEVNKPCWRP